MICHGANYILNLCNRLSQVSIFMSYENQDSWTLLKVIYKIDMLQTHMHNCYAPDTHLDKVQCLRNRAAHFISGNYDWSIRGTEVKKKWQNWPKLYGKDENISRRLWCTDVWPVMPLNSNLSSHFKLTMYHMNSLPGDQRMIWKYRCPVKIYWQCITYHGTYHGMDSMIQWNAVIRYFKH